MRPIHLFAVAAIVGAAAGFASAAGVAAATFVPVAVSGDPTPDMPGTTFSPGWSVMRDNGEIAMFGSVTGTNTSGIWSGTAGSLHKAAGTDQIAPGAGVRFLYFRGLHVDTLGRVTFPAVLNTGTSADAGIWQGAPGALQLIAYANSIAPGTTVRYGSVFVDYRTNATGQTAFFNQLRGTGVDALNDGGVWLASGGSVQLVAREGELVPVGAGIPAGTKYHTIDPRFVLNDNGQMAFQSLNTPGGSVVWGASVAAPQPAPLVVAGRPAPGMAAGVNFVEFGGVRLNNAGQIAVQARVFGSGIGDANNRGLWVGLPGALQLVALASHDAPGTEAGVKFGTGGFTSGDHLALNGAGQVAFSGTLSGPGVASANDTGVWVGGPSGLHLAGRSGYELPDDFDVRAIQMNDHGDVVFVGGLPLQSTELWLYQMNEKSLHRLLGAGDLLDIEPGPGETFKTIAGVNMSPTSGGEDGSFLSLTDARKLIVDVTFAGGGGGVFVTDLSTVPEPAGLGAAIATVALMSRRRRARR